MTPTTSQLKILTEIPLFAGLAADGAQCPGFLARGEVLQVQPGTRVVEQGESGDFYVLLEGEIQVLKRVGTQEMLLTTHHSGDFFGELPLVLSTNFFASGVAVGPATLFRLDAESFWRMLGACPSVLKTILRTLAQRVQSLEAISQSHEKLVSLGTMAAGLAHELNNPAAAISRSAHDLRETSRMLPALACKLAQHELRPIQREFVSALLHETIALDAPPLALATLELADAEDDMADWLAHHGVPASADIAATLTADGLDRAWLENLAGGVPPAAISEVLQWVAANLSIARLVADIDDSSKRISALVGSVKSYAFMDRGERQQVDVREGLDSTLTMLHHKLKATKVQRCYNDALPAIAAYGSELNQVWTNLIDNAADAVAGRADATISIEAQTENDFVVVAIVDNGPGLCDEALNHLFEPFFTTKDVGKGTGLGLVISYRIVAGHHNGTIHVDSEPGCTRFEVRLPRIYRD